jgi:hypothetical protein
MALPSQGTLTTELIAAEIGAPTGAGVNRKFAGGSNPTTDSLIYYYRPGNINTTGVDQSAPFSPSDFYGQEALYKCTSFTAGGSTGTATVIVYPGITTNISVSANTTNYYCARVNYNGGAAVSNVSGLTVNTGSNCNGNIAAGNSAASPFVDYGTFGVRLYSSYNLDGSGTSTNWICNDAGGSYAGTFWANPNNNTSDGRLNQASLWSGSQGYVGTGSLSFAVNAVTTKDYYVGIAADNYCSIYLDNVLKVAQTANINDTNNFKYWHIYPINITAGIHTLLIRGINNAGPGANPGSMAVEIYDNTSTQISASIAAAPNGSSTPSGLTILYSSKNYRGAGVIGAAYNNISVQCPVTTTTTTSTTTTTTTVDPYDYYSAIVYSCDTCAPLTNPPYPSNSTIVKVLRPFTPNFNAAYNSSTVGQSNVFFDLIASTSGPATIIINPTEYTQCYAVCGRTTTTTTTSTTTTTTTAAPTTSTTTTTTTTEAPSGYTIDYDFQQSAQSGEFTITVNGSVPVSVTSNSSGQITVPENAAIGVSVSAGAQSPLIAQASLIIYDAGTEIYNNVQEGYPFASNLYNYTATGNGTISALAYEY